MQKEAGNRHPLLLPRRRAGWILAGLLGDARTRSSRASGLPPFHFAAASVLRNQQRR